MVISQATTFSLPAPTKTQLAVTKLLAVSHADRRAKDAAGHGPPRVNVTLAGIRVQRWAGCIVVEILKAFLVDFGVAQQACFQIAGELRPMLVNPRPRAPLNSCGQSRIGGPNRVHPGS
jgi:hypothetical protein